MKQIKQNETMRLILYLENVVHITDEIYDFHIRSKGISCEHISEKGCFEGLDILDIIDYILMYSTLITAQQIQP